MLFLVENLGWKALDLILLQSWGKLISSPLCHRISKGKYGKGGFAPDPAIIIIPMSLSGGGDHTAQKPLQCWGRNRIQWHFLPKSDFLPNHYRSNSRAGCQNVLFALTIGGHKREKKITKPQHEQLRAPNPLSCMKSVCSSSFLGSSKQSLSFQNLSIRKSQLKGKWKWHWSNVRLYVVPYPNWQGQNISSQNNTKCLIEKNNYALIEIEI